MNWKAFTIDELRKLLEGFDRWFLDGGLALDHFLGKRTRAHGDIDVGVMSEDAEALLAVLTDCGFEVFDACNGLEAVTSPSNRKQSYNYWISDGKHYKLQVLVYETEGDYVLFRRNSAIKWPKEVFTLRRGDLSVANPMVIYAFKVTTKAVEQKDLTDVATFLNLMESYNA